MNQQDDPVAITSVRPARSVDIRQRQTRYLLSMGIRTLCFVLAIVTTGPVRWFFVAGAIVLPYVAVVLANATDRRQTTDLVPFVADQKPQIEAPKPATDPLP